MKIAEELKFWIPLRLIAFKTSEIKVRKFFNLIAYKTWTYKMAGNGNFANVNRKKNL